MKSSILLFFLLFIGGLFGVAQRRTYLGAQFGPSFYPFNVTDQGNKLKKSFTASSVWGFTISQEINRYLFIESGIYRNEYSDGFMFKGIPSSDYSSGVTVLQIPVKATGRFNIHKNKIHLTGTVGLHYATNLDYYWDHYPGDTTMGGGSGYYIDPNNNSVHYSYIFYDLSKRLLLIETGLGIEFTLYRTAVFSVQFSKLTGFKNLIRDDIRYVYNNEPEKTGTAYNNGSYTALMFGLKYPISRIWNKK